MERRKCRRCGHPMTRIITQTIEPGGSRWEAWYSCLSCGYETAAVCLALNDIHGFGGKRCHRVLEKMQRYIVDCFTSADAVQAVYKRMGLTLDFGDPLNWIELENEE